MTIVPSGDGIVVIFVEVVICGFEPLWRVIADFSSLMVLYAGCTKNSRLSVSMSLSSRFSCQ